MGNVSDYKYVSDCRSRALKFDPAWFHTYVEIGHEIISTIILFHSADSFKKGCCWLQAKYVHKVLANPLLKLAQEKSVV